LFASSNQGYNRVMLVGEFGEFRLIKELAEVLDRYTARPDRPSSDPLIIGIGDDTAVWRNGPGLTIATTDAMVENVHYRADTTSWFELGWKAMASNLSDVASMGGTPRYAVVVLALRPNVQVAEIDEMYQGMAAIAGQYDTRIVGGDVVSSPTACMVGVTVYGESYSSDNTQLLRRTGARAGDLIAVSGTVGGSGAGLAMILESRPFSKPIMESLRHAHARPTPRVTEGLVLVEAGVRAAMDVSDGLVGDLQKMCHASHVAARIMTDSVPVPVEVRQAFPDRWLDFALYGGEDYELLFTAPKEVMATAIASLAARGPISASVIGEVILGTPGQVLLVDSDGQEGAPLKGGWDHFGH
jgi:thiamine-monophosphate kinase